MIPVRAYWRLLARYLRPLRARVSLLAVLLFTGIGFQAANPQIKDINRIYAGQKIYMPDPSMREQSWYSSLFDETGNLVERVAAAAGGSPPPPAADAGAAELDSQPTRQVSGDAVAAGATAATAAAVETEVPVVQTSPVEEPPSGSGRHLALVAAVVVLFGLAAVVAAGIFAWKSGLFKAAIGGDAKIEAADTEAQPIVAEPEQESVSEEESETQDSATAAGAATTISPVEAEPDPVVQPESLGAGRTQSGPSVQEPGEPSSI